MGSEKLSTVPRFSTVLSLKAANKIPMNRWTGVTFLYSTTKFSEMHLVSVGWSILTKSRSVGVN